jgi:hypothetical protein
VWAVCCARAAWCWSAGEVAGSYSRVGVLCLRAAGDDGRETEHTSCQGPNPMTLGGSGETEDQHKTGSCKTLPFPNETANETGPSSAIQPPNLNSGGGPPVATLQAALSTHPQLAQNTARIAQAAQSPE